MTSTIGPCLKTSPVFARPHLGSACENVSTNHTGTGPSKTAAAPLRLLQLGACQSALNVRKLNAEKSFWSGKRKGSVECLFSFHNFTSIGIVEKEDCSQASVLQLKVAAFEGNAGQASIEHGAARCWQVRGDPNTVHLLARRSAVRTGLHDTRQQNVIELRKKATWEMVHALASAVSADFELEASMTLRLAAGGEGVSQELERGAMLPRHAYMAVVGGLLGQWFGSGYALAEDVAESGATVLEAAGQAAAQSDALPSWLQPAILAAPLLLYGGFYWYRDNVDQRLSPFDYVTLLLVVLAVSNLVLAIFFQVRLF